MKNTAARIATILVLLTPLALAAETLVGVIPVAGSTPGAFGARFRTTLQLANPSTETIRGSVVFHHQGFPGAPSDPRLPFELAPHATRSWADVVEEMGASGLGSIDIFVEEGPRPVAVARAFADGDGTRGNTIPLMRPEEALQIGESATLLVPSDLERFRFNLGIRTLSAGARVRIRAYDAAGTLVSTAEALSLPADYFEQRPGAGFLGTALPPNGSIVVRIEEGSAIVYGTTTDNRTNDPSFQLDRRMNKRPRLVGVTVERRPDGTARIRICVSDPDGDRVAVTVAAPPATGTLGPIEEDGAGCVATIFSGGGTGGASIGFALTDTDENVTLIDVEVAGGGNRAPVAHAQLVSVPEDGSRAIVLTGTDPDSDPLTFSIVSGPSHGTLTGAPPNVTYRPAANYTGPDSFTFRVTDGVESASGVVSIIVTAVNDGPVAGDLSVTTAEDTPAPITLAGTDIDGDALQFFIGSAPSHGTLSGTAPNLVYTPAANFNGADSFTFFASDGRASSAAAQVSIVVTPVNDAPVATGGPVATDEDTPVAVALTATDVDGDLLTWTVTAPAHGSLSGTAPNLTYTPAANYAGPDAIVFSASDGRLTSGSATIAITVRPVSDSPAAAADVYATAQGVTLNVAAPGILANDTDPEGDALSATLASAPSSGTLTLSANGGFTYTPAAGFTGTASFTYRAGDGTSLSAPATVSINVNAANAPPSAAGQTIATAEDTAIAIVLTGSDPDGDAIGFAIAVAPANGTLTGTPPNVTYTPAPDFSGSDSFSFTVTDGVATSAPAVVSITVTPVNDPPAAFADVYGTTAGSPLTVSAPGVLANDTDIDGGALRAVVESVPANGTLTLNLDGSFTYTPAAFFSGIDGFDYRAGDGIATSAPAHVTINVSASNAPPLATAASVTTNEDAAIGITLTGTDPDGDALGFTVVTPPASGALSGAAPNLAYAPNADFNGSDSFTFTATDGIATSAPATISITVTPVNDLPVAADEAYATNEDTTLTVVAPGVLANDADVDGNPLTAFVVTPPANGVATLGTDGALVYTPAANFHGSDEIAYRVNDGAGDSNVAHAAITVLAVNDDPVAAADAATVNEDSGATAIAVLANDTFAPDSGETLTITGTGATSNGGAVTIVGGTSLSYTPAPNFAGTETFTYTISDGNGGSATATVTVTVTNVNDAPNAADDAVTVGEDSGANAIAVLGNDSILPDAGETLTITGVTQGANGTVAITGGGTGLTYQPNANYFGGDSFTYTISDGNGGVDTASVTVTVTSVNDNPTAAADAATFAEDSAGNSIDVLANDSFAPDTGETLTITGTGATSNGGVVTIVGGTSLSYTPAPNFFGTETFTYTIGDGNGGSATATVTVTVTNVNDNPAAADDAFVVAEDSSSNALAVLANDSFAPDTGETLSITGTGATSNGGVVTIVGGTSLSYTPAANYFGTETFTYTIADGNGGTATATVTVTVTNVNDDPTANDDAATILEDAGPSAIAVLTNDSILPDTGETLTITGVTQGTNGAVVITGGGSGLTYQPNANYFGGDSFTYTISDGNGGVDTATVTMTITSVNDDPSAGADPFTVPEDSAGNAFAVLANDTFAPDTGETLTITGTGATSNGGAVTIVGGTSLSYTPAPNFAGTETFTYTISDGNGGSATAMVTVTVTNVNDNPSAADDAATVSEDSGANAVAVLANDSILPDAGETLAITGVTQGTNGTVVITGGGSGLTYQPNPNYVGPDSFTYTIGDGNGGVDTATVTVTVASVNDNPTAADDAATFAEDSAGNAIAVLANDSFAPDTGETLTITGTGTTSNGGVVTIVGGTSLSYTPAPNFFGTETFTYTIADGNGGSATATVTVTVTNVNDNPSAADDAFTVSEDSASNAFAVLANDGIAPDTGETLSITGTGATSNGGVVTIVGGTSLSYTPAASFFGTETFTYTIADGNGGTATATVTVTVTNVNDDPTANDDAATILEDAGASAISVLTNDSILPDTGETLTITAVTQGTNGAVVITGGGSGLTYQPNANYFGGDSFTYTISDGNGGVDTATVTMTVTSVNDAPVVSGATFAIDENTANGTSVGTPITATDVESNGITWSITGGNTGGAFAIGAASGQITVANAAALDRETNPSFALTVTATDNGAPNEAGSATVTINLNNLNDTAPVANGDGYTVAEGATLNVALPGVISNDTDADGATAFAATLVAGPARGALTFNADGSFSYVHDGSHLDSDSFTYRVSDGVQLSNVATVTLTVTLSNDAPVAVANAYAVARGGSITISAPGVLGNDTDEEGNTLTASLGTTTSSGTLTLNADGSFTYVHDGVGTTPVSFTYRANDGTSDSSLVTVTIAVTASANPPLATDDSYAVTNGGTLTISAPGVLANDSDPEGSALTAVLGTTTANGTLTLNSNGSFTYVHNAGSGGDSFSYGASDGQSATYATVTITILPGANTAPVAVDDGPYTVARGGTLTVTAAGVLANDTDADGNDLGAAVVTTTTNGTLTLNADGGFTYVNSGSAATSDSFTYAANDGEDASSAATVTITVTATNAAPTADDDGLYTTSQNQPLNVPAPGVLAGDADSDGNPIHPVLVTAPANGTLTLNANGSFTYNPDIDYTGGDSFVYRASDGTAESADATVTIDVVANAAPVAVADAYAVNEDATLAVAAAGVLANDTDAETDPLTAILVSGPTNAASFTLNANGSFSYTPNANFNGGDSFTYKANDGQDSNVATVTITINSVNDVPSFATGGDVIVDEDSGAYSATWAGSISAGPANESTQTLTFNVSLSATSPTLTFSSAPAIASNGTLSFTPAANAYGTTTVTVTLSDNGGTANGGVDTSASQQFTLTVTGINDAPVVTAGGSLAYTENGAAAAADGTITVADGDSTNLLGATVQITANYASAEDVLSYATALGISGAWNPGTGTLTLSGTTTVANYQAALRNVKYENTSNDPSGATRTLTWIVDDGGAENATSAAVTSTVAVTAVNDPPVANAVGPLATYSAIPISFAAATLGGTDAEAGTTVTVDTTPGTVTNGAVVIGADGSFTFTPAAGLTGNGAASFQYRVCDDGEPGAGVCGAYVTVSFNISGPGFYFVKAAPAGSANCTLGNECTLATATGSIGATTGRTIFISDAGTHNAAVALNASAALIGQGATGASFDALFSINPATASPGTLAARPSINQSAPTIQQTVTLAASSVVRGLSIVTSGVTAMSGGAVASPAVSEVSVNATGAAALVLSGTTSANLAFSSLSSSGATNAVSLTNVTGTVGASGGTIAGGAGAAFLVSGGSVGGTWSGAITQGNNALAVDVTNHATGSLSFASVSATNGTGIRFTNADGTYSFTAAGLAGGDAGVDILAGTDAANGSQGTFTFGAASSLTNPSGSLFDIQGSKPTFTYSGSFSKTSAGTGINLTGNTGGTIAFDGPTPTETKTLSTSTGVAINATSNTNTTINFSGGGLAVTTTTATALNATSGGTITVQGASNTLTSGAGSAVIVSGTTIGVAGITFQSINSTTASSNVTIALANTGSGPFKVDGTGVAGSGGTISNKTADAITLTNTSGLVTLEDMIIQDIGSTAGGFHTISGHDAIHGENVNGGLALSNVTIRRISDNAINGSTFASGASTVFNGLTINNSTIQLTNRYNVAGSGDANNEGMVRALGIRGTVSITNSTFEDGGELLDFFVTGGTLTMTATSNSFNRSYKEFTSGVTASIGNHCIDVTVSAGFANLTLGSTSNAALGNNFLNCRLGSVRVVNDTGSTGSIMAVIGRNNFVVNDHSSGIGGDFDFPMGGVLVWSLASGTTEARIAGNYFDETTRASGGLGSVSVYADAGSVEARIDANTFDTLGDGTWDIRSRGGAVATVQVNNNTYINGTFTCPDVSCAGGYTGPALYQRAEVQDGSTLNLTNSSEIYSAHDTSYYPGNSLEARVNNVGGASTMCVALSNLNAPQGYALERYAGTFNLYRGLSGFTGVCTTGQCQTVLQTNNVLGGAGNVNQSPPSLNMPGTVNVVAGQCALPTGGIF